jgi:hypothetical protein
MNNLRRVLLLSALVLMQSAMAADNSSTQRGSTRGSVAKLPDWSGTWAMIVKDHEFFSKETRANDGGLVPFTPKYQALRANMRDSNEPENLAQCLPAGIPGVMLHRIALEWLFTPNRITMLTENGEIRRIYTDGRAHRSLDELEYSFQGDSIGHWEGDTLVVDTIGFPMGALLKNGWLHPTLNTRFVERMHLIDKDHLQIDSEISDPEIYTKPYKSTRTLERIDYELPDPQCAQTSHSATEGAVITPPAE